MRYHLLLASVLTFGAAYAADVEPKSTLYILRVFTLPKTDGLHLLAQDLDDRALQQHLLDAAKTNPALLDKLILVAGNNQNDIRVQLADELIYPTEFDPQQCPQQLAIGDSALVQVLQKFLQPSPPPEPLPQAAPAANPAPLPRHPVNLGLGIITSITPTAFETALLGDQLDITVNIEGVTSINYERKRLAGFQLFNGEQQAHFNTRQLQSSISVVPNVPYFLGTCSAAQSSGSAFEDKAATISLAFLTARASVLPSLVAAVKPPEDGTSLMAHLSVISLPKMAAAALIQEGITDNALLIRLNESIKAGQGRLETFLSGRVTVGNQVTLAETDEYIYPIEFDPPQLVSNLVIADDALLSDLRAGRQLGTGAAPPTSNPHNGGFGFMTRSTPTAFAMRPMGTSLEIELRRSDQDLILLAKPTLTRLIGQQVYIGVSHPIFSSQSLSMTQSIRIGTPLLLGTLNRPLNTGLKNCEADDRIWFTFITVQE